MIAQLALWVDGFDSNDPARLDLPVFVPSPDSTSDLCSSLHGKALARDEAGRIVCARCGGEVRR